MKYLKITNDGILDIRLVALMGGTTKSHDDFKIGQFGTGLKYTMAYLIRNNVDFHIFAGKDKIEIETVSEEIRGEVFNIICINGNRTSITDKMGHDWNAWMIVRELWCNALDEGGYQREITEIVQPEENKTCFYIQVTQEIKSVLDNWNKYFLHEQKPLFENETVAIYPGGDKLRLYKNGVLIKESDTLENSVFSYDMKNAPINELRQYIGTMAYPVFKCLQRASENIITNFLESINEKHFEASMDWNWFEGFGTSWKNAIGNAKIIHQKAVDAIKERGLEIDLTGIIIVPEPLYKALTQQFQGIGALRIADKVNEFYETFSSASDEKVKQALVILEEAGYNFSPELKFVFGVFGDKNIWAKISMDKKEVLISENIADKSLFDVVTTLIEENEHFKSGHGDCTREFQQHFINLYTNQLLKNAEIIL